MTMSTLMVIASVGLAYVGLGVWAITLIFPRPGSRARGSHHHSGSHPPGQS